VYTVLNRGDLAQAVDTGTATFEGALYNAGVSFFWVDLPPGARVRLHRHPCEEIFILLEGRATFTVGAETLEATAGQIVIVSPQTPHAFRSSGDGPLRQIDILPQEQIITEWLEE